ncbi:MAG: GNAT family N-acetyltransferase [Frankiaceae bacterium]
MSPVDVHLAEAAELPAARAVRWRVFVEEQGVPVELEYDGEDQRAHHAVAVLDGAVVGTGRLVVGDGGVGVVGRMAVVPPARGRGVGAALLSLLEQRAGELGLGAVELHAQAHATGFYHRAGYAAVGAAYEEAGIPHVTMRKPLLRP